MPIIALPSITSEMNVIGEQYQVVDLFLNKNKRQRNKLQTLKTGLMQDLLTGKVRVTPLLEQAEEATA